MLRRLQNPITTVAAVAAMTVERSAAATATAHPRDHAAIGRDPANDTAAAGRATPAFPRATGTTASRSATPTVTISMCSRGHS